MGLSNTATPKYYEEFRYKVLHEGLPINEEIALEMYRIDELIADPSIYYDENAIDGWIKFCEAETTLTDGSDLVLLDTFKLWAEQVFGWYYFIEKDIYVPGVDGEEGGWVTKVVKKRLTRKQYLIVARGAAKSMYSSLHQNFGLNVDDDTTHQITTAPTMKQAEEVMSPIRTSITRARGPVFKFLTAGSIFNTTGSKADRVKLTSTKKGIENFLTGSLLEIRPMSINKLQGLRCKYATVDEWLSGDLKEDVIGAIEQGASKLDDYLIIATSSEGIVRNGSGDTIKMELLDILRGKYDAKHISIWYYKLDDISEVNDPEMWVKAQPNIGYTVSYETYQLDVERAENSPSARNDILAKRFGLPMEGFTYFFTYEDTVVHILPKRAFYGLPCTMGVDLSQGDDFCAFTFLFPLGNGDFGTKTLCFVTQRSYEALPLAMKLKYDEFIDEGSLIVMEDKAILDMDDVYEDLFQFIMEHNYIVEAVGYDPYGAEPFLNLWTADNGKYGLEKVRQGSRTESIPLGELRNLANARMLKFDQALMSFCMGNAITLEDLNGNRKLAKIRQDRKIDSVAALMDALVAYQRHKDLFN